MQHVVHITPGDMDDVIELLDDVDEALEHLQRAHLHLVLEGRLSTHLP